MDRFYPSEPDRRRSLMTMASTPSTITQPAPSRHCSRKRGCSLTHEHHPTHGQAWVILALYLELSEQEREAADAEKKAIHYGAEAFAKSEGQRIREDLGLPEDAG